MSYNDTGQREGRDEDEAAVLSLLDDVRKSQLQKSNTGRWQPPPTAPPPQKSSRWQPPTTLSQNSSAPTSTLANLLSSQRRSTAQSDRYRVQRARPFADSTQVDQELKLAGSQEYSQPEKRGVDNLQQQQQQQTIIHTQQDESPPRKRRSRWDMKPPPTHAGGSKNIDDIPIQKQQQQQQQQNDAGYSRWDVKKPSIQSTLSHDSGEHTANGTSMQKQHYRQQQTYAAEGKESYKNGGNILNRGERSMGEKKISAPPVETSKGRHGETTPAYAISSSSSKDSYSRDGQKSQHSTYCGASHGSGGNSHSHSHLRPGERSAPPVDTKRGDGETKSYAKSSISTSYKSSYSGDSAAATGTQKSRGHSHSYGNSMSGENVSQLIPKKSLSRADAPPKKERDTKEMGNGAQSTIPKKKKDTDSLNSPKSKVGRWEPPKGKTPLPPPDTTSAIKANSVPPLMEESKIPTKKRKPADGPNNDKASSVEQPPKSKPKREAAAAIPAPSAPPPPKRKRKKDFSPFRVKVGCVVAVRFRKHADGGNSEVVPVVRDGEDSFRVINSPLESTVDDVAKKSGAKGKNGVTNKNRSKKGKFDAALAAQKPKQYEVWSDPIPGLDDGMSLLGSWIRCRFSKAFIKSWQKSNKGEIQVSPGRIVEGNVISILGNNLDGQRGIAVCLLVDESSINSLPYLQVVSDDKDVSEKRRNLEAQIRGEDKVVVKVVLPSVFDQRKRSQLDAGVVLHWSVRKRVSAKPAGKKPNKAERQRNKQKVHSLFVGDGNDPQTRQEHNWQWIASRATCQSTVSGTDQSVLGNNTRESFSHLAGEVVNMDVSEDGSTSLATVTIRRLWTPEQTVGGRLAHHGTSELFDSSNDNSEEVYFQAPIEDLVVIGKRIDRHYDMQKTPNLHLILGDDLGGNFFATHSYRAGDDTYMPLCEDVATKKSVETCHYCQRLYHDSLLHKCEHEENDVCESLWCPRCLRMMKVSPSRNDEETWSGPCCKGRCDCSLCRDSAAYEIPNASVNEVGGEFSGLASSLQSTSPVDFILPNDVGQLSIRPSYIPLTGDKKSKSYIEAKGKGGGKKKNRSKSDTKTKSRKKLKAKGKDASVAAEEEFVCNRAVPFDQLDTKLWGSSKVKLETNDDKQPFFRENARPRAIKIGKVEEKPTLTGRAARASQRRMFKSLAALGDHSKKVDRLAGRDREQLLRFDKSRIHGWGVFAEEAISAGDLIIEYRGELIGNAVADKREAEYEKAKLDDYMFRIDAYTVCDATILGNVARYINASCTPNCYTKIITAGENKRIVIYAQRDIQRGEELCYDYKFAHEHDPTKRIPCNCGAPKCRGYMN